MAVNYSDICFITLVLKTICAREYLRGKYHYTFDLFEWFGLVCFANKNKNCHLSYS